MKSHLKRKQHDTLGFTAAELEDVKDSILE